MVDGCPAITIFFLHCLKVKIFVALPEMCIMVWKSQGNLVPLTGFCGSPGQGSHKTGNILGKPRRWDPYQSDRTLSALCSSAVLTCSYKTREQIIITVLEGSIGQRFGSPPYLHLICVRVCVRARECVCEFDLPGTSV